MKVLGSMINRSWKYALGAVAVFASFVSMSAQTPAPYLLPYTINTIAGGGTAPKAGDSCPGPNGTTATALDAFGDGCLASSSSVVTNTDIHDVGVDPQGNVYFLDLGTYTILRKIDARSGVINVLAGSFPATTVCSATIDQYGDGTRGNDSKASAMEDTPPPSENPAVSL